MELDLVKERLYYTIGEVSSALGINSSTIRYWEKHFPVLRPSKRTGTSKRKFDLNDIQALYKIKCLLKDDKYSIKKAQLMLQGWKPVMQAEEFIRSVNESKRPKIVLSAENCETARKVISEIKKRLGYIK
jgi:DNA-binding transcriptional MerR regulator